MNDPLSTAADAADAAARGRAVWAAAAPPGACLGLRLAGSRSHNTHTPASDYDWHGVYVAPTRRLLAGGLDPLPDTVSRTKGGRDGAGDDYSFHEVGKFLEILLKGNAGAVEFLFGGWLDPDAAGCPAWLLSFRDDLLHHRRAFLTHRVVAAYFGYAEGQLKRLREGRVDPARGDETWKDVAHGVRLLYEARRVARGREPAVRLPDGSPERDVVCAVRAGRWTPARVALLASQLTGDVRDALAGAGDALPAHPPREWAAEWLVRLRLAEMDHSGW